MNHVNYFRPRQRRLLVRSDASMAQI